MVSVSDATRVEFPDEVLVALRKEAALYGRLESYAARQRRLIVSNKTEPLLALLGDRQKLVVELTRIGEALAPVRREWAGRREAFSDDQRIEADELFAQTAKRLQRIMDMDTKDARVLAVKKEMASGSVRSMQATGQAIAAYRQPGSREVVRRKLDESS